MHHKHRKIIFIVFVIAFLTSIPILLLYTGGYRYNIKKNKIEKTGNLLVDTQTKNITVALNNKEYYSKGELRLKNILPGEYLIKITKLGYYDWQKKIDIRSELTSFIKNIRLFKKELPINILGLPIEKFYSSPDKNKILYIINDKKTKKDILFMYDINTETATEVLTSTLSILDIVWSPDNYKFYIKTESSYILMDIRSGKIDSSFIKNEIHNLKWHEKNSLVLYAEMSDGIYKIDLFFNSISKIFNSIQKINDFYVNNNNYLYIIDQYNLKQIDLKNNKIVSVPLERQGYIIKSVIDERIYLLNKQKIKLQVFNLPLNSLSIPSLLVNAKNFDTWNNNLIFYNDFELWIYNYEDGKKELITRIGTNIKKANWINGTNYIMFTLENKIKTIEVHKEDGRQIIELIKFDNIYDVILNENYTIYFTGKMNKTNGLFKLEI